MDKNEVICISSDDEEETPQNNKNRQEAGTNQKADSYGSTYTKVEVLLDDDKKKESCGQKRKASQTDETSSNVGKKMKSMTCTGKSEIVNSNVKGDSCITECIVIQDKKQEKEILKPKLVVKEKRSICEMEQDIFPMFISLCLQKDRSKDMQTIVNKLKRRYEQLDPKYAHSEAFTNFLNEKRNAIVNSTSKLYIHIAEVMNEMKRSCKGKSQLLSNGQNCTTSTSTSNTLTLNNSVTSSTSDMKETNCKIQEVEEEDDKDEVTQNRIRLILKTMEKCRKIIKKLEESETDFDDENNSNYIKLERYKYKMVELYNKYCELSEETPDAGRLYLRPKHLSTTGIVSVDQAITRFINSKISKRNKLKRIGATADAVIFPDYTDILQCIKRCNELHNIGLDNKKQQQLAKKAFTELGEYLQRVRRHDYWDTFSLFLEESDDDPALKDPTLAEKLLRNKKEGEKRLANVFQEYVKKQEELKDEIAEEKTTSGNEEDEDNSVENEDEDNDNQDDEDNDQNEHDSDTCINLPIDDEIDADEEGKSSDQDCILPDKDNSNKDEKNNLSKNDSNETDKHNPNKPTSREDRNSLANTCTVINVIDIDESPKADCSMLCTNGKLETAKSKESDKIDIDGAESIISCGDDPTLKIKEKTNVNSANVLKSPPGTVLNTLSQCTIIHSENSNGPEEDAPSILSEEVTDNDPQEGGKPLLRVRSFAKPPTTWEDSRQRTEKSVIDESEAKVVNEDTVVDISNEVSKGETIKKYTHIQIGSKILPIKKEKCKTLVLPPGNNVINVKNITNNHIKLNTRNVNPSTVSKMCNGQVMSLRQVVGLSGSSTIIHVPFSNQQTTSAGNLTKPVRFKQNGAIVQIVQPNKTIVIPTRQIGGDILKSSTINFPTTKPK